MSDKKAQHYSLDLMIASVIFITLFLFISSTWEDTRIKMSYASERMLLEETTKHSFDTLIFSIGNTSGWTGSSSSKDIGIADKRSSFIDQEQIRTIALENDSMYNTYKNKLGMIGPGYEFSFNATIYNNDMSYNSSYIIGYTGPCLESSVKKRVLPTIDKNYAYLKFTGCKTI